MTYDAALGRVILFGGQDNNGYFNDTWERIFNAYSYTYTYTSANTDTHTHSKPHSYTNTHTDSISYSGAQNDSQASSHATSSPNTAAVTEARRIWFSPPHSNGNVI
jgi:hypothetical protein